FPYASKSRKTGVPPPQALGQPRKPSSTSAPRGGVPWFLRLWLVTMNAAFALHRETIMDDDLKDVQSYPHQPDPAKVWPDRRGEGNSPASRRGGLIGG